MPDPSALTITDDRPDEMPAPEPVPEVPEPAEVSDAPLVDVATIAEGLRMVGSMVHAFAGHPEVPEHWSFTAPEVDALAPPLASIINRHATARAVAARSPELAVALALGQYGLRNARLTAAIRQAEADLAAQAEPAPAE